MKRRSPLLKLKYFLEHLESNFYNENKRKVDVLHNSFPPKENCRKMILLCKNRGYIKSVDIKDGREVHKGYEITLEGLDFLEQLRKRDLERKNNQMQENLVLTSVIIALSTVFIMFDKIDLTSINIFKWILPPLIIGFTFILIVNFIRRR